MTTPIPKPLTPSPALLNCSDSDSSDSDNYSRLDHNMAQQPRTTLLHSDTMAFSIVEPGKLPIVTTGKLTPELLTEFENRYYVYFLNKQVLDEKLKVGCITWGLQDAHIQVWYRTNQAMVDAAGFDAFMKTVCANWLEVGWEHEVKLAILSSSQGNMPISDWVRLLESINTVLIGTMVLLSEEQICNQIKTHMHPKTLIASNLAETHLIMDYTKFNNALKLIDDKCIGSKTQLQEAINKMFAISFNASNQHHNCSNCVVVNYTNSYSFPTVSSMLSTDCIPALSPAKHALLQQHKGCFKCHLPYTNHLCNKCPNGFPSKADYKVVMEADMLVVERKYNKAKRTKVAVAVISTKDSVLTLRLTAVVIALSILGNGSDSECVFAPFFFTPFLSRLPYRWLVLLYSN